MLCCFLCCHNMLYLPVNETIFYTLAYFILDSDFAGNRFDVGGWRRDSDFICVFVHRLTADD